MTFSVARSGRAALACAAMIAFAAAMSTAQTRAHIAQTPPSPAAIPTAEPVAAVAIVAPRRDPFAGGFLEQPRPPAPSAPAIDLRPPPALLPLPPNAGAPDGTFPAAGRVSAIATGAHPFALIDDGKTTRLIAAGDSYAGRHVVAIDAAGIHLDDGTLFDLALRAASPAAALKGAQR